MKLLISLIMAVSIANLTGCSNDNISGVYENKDGQIDIIQTSKSTFMFKILTVSPTGGHGIGELAGSSTFYSENKMSNFTDNTYGLCQVTFYFDKKKLVTVQTGSCGMGLGANATGEYVKNTSKTPDVIIK